jgi:hypothetical protein
MDRRTMPDGRTVKVALLLTAVLGLALGALGRDILERIL